LRRFKEEKSGWAWGVLSFLRMMGGGSGDIGEVWVVVEG
jgi:hypothetical protein